MGNLDSTIRKAAGLEQADRLVKDSKSTFDKAKKALTFAQNPRSCFGWFILYNDSIFLLYYSLSFFQLFILIRILHFKF